MTDVDRGYGSAQNLGHVPRPIGAKTWTAQYLSPSRLGFAAVLLLCAPYTGARADYISIAVIGGQGLDFHGIGRSETKESAKSAAMAQCRNQRCKVVMTYGPGQCAHIVTGTRQIFWNTNLFSPREKKYVLADCGKVDSHCRVLRSECLPE